MTDEAVILCGGLGTRLRGVVDTLPKSMADISGRPFLSYLLSVISNQGIRKVILAAGYLHKIIADYFRDRFIDISIDYSIEEMPLGTGGAIKKAMEKVTVQDVFIINGDTFFDIEFERLFSFYKATSADIAIALREMQDTDRYGWVELSRDGRVTGFTEKGYRDNGLINGGIYLLKKEIFDRLELSNSFSFEQDLLMCYYNQIGVYGAEMDGYFIDIGVPEDYHKAVKELKQRWENGR